MPNKTTNLPTEEDMKSLITKAASKSKNAPCASKYKAPKNLAEIRAVTPLFMTDVISNGSKQSQMRKHKSKYFDNADEAQLQILRFFELCAETNSPPNVGLLAVWLGVARDTLNAWERDETHFLSDTIKKAKDAIRAWGTYMAQTNQISAVMAIFSQKTEHGVIEEQYINISAQPWRDKTDKVSDDEFARQAAAAIESGTIQILPDGSIKE